MSCVRPGAVTPEDLLAYAAGEAPPHVVEHVRACPACAATAAEYARTHRQLAAALYRFDCPSPQRLGDYEFHLLSPDDQTQVAAHVVECPLCAAELRQLRDFLALEPAPIPEGTSGWVKRIIATLLPAAPGVSYAGVRGAGDPASHTYQAADLTITVRTGTDAARGHAYLSGHIWRENAAPDALAGQTVSLSSPGGAALTTTIGDLGEFAFDVLEPGTYHLGVHLADQVVVVENVQIDG